MRVLVCGGRNYADQEKLDAVLDQLDGACKLIQTVIHGGATGADNLAALWAAKRAREQIQFDPDWYAHGRAAGPIRNAQMLKDGKPDLVIAFPGGKGTANMIQQAKSRGVRVMEVDDG